MSLKISTKQLEGVTVVHCNGRIVFGEEAANLREQVKNLLTTQKNIVLNLGGVSYIDSGGLGTLVGLYTSARAAGGDIKLANLTQRVGDQLQITKLVTVFEVFDSEEKAVSSFGATAKA
ncbi:MAG: STAS domain-containing protein [Candidatus Koribacter versatilis]|uniref:Anti-sigma factor antagonist n=1 Tax=Candidatus Korobacter versatilis TaxID=658062 RepID=A0A932A8X9_9BACT|nr:STAS domain-containing protein [Candidatus Koribacter versatilis]